MSTSLRTAAPTPVDPGVSYSGMVAELRKVFETGKTRDVSWRVAQLQALSAMVRENHQRIRDAVLQDLGGSPMRGFFDLLAVPEAEFALKNVAKWAAPEQKGGFGSITQSTTVRKEPKGVVLIIAPWNYPMQLMLTPLVSAIAAGNCVVLKPSEVAPNCSALAQELIEKYLDTSCVKVVQGAVPEATALLRERWDHIFYTGNGAVARVVMRAAAEHLTPVTLELGGKSPVIVDSKANVEAAANRIWGGKWINCGQTCIAPDYVICHEDVCPALIARLKEIIDKCYRGDPKGSRDWGKIINARHVERVRRLLEGSEDKVVYGDLSTVDAGERFFPPVLIANPSLDSPVMSEEIFGPLLPILTYSGSDPQVPVDMVRKICPRPLALYIFTEDMEFARAVLDRTESGGGCVNAVMDQFSAAGAPFGGVGESGTGKYHGRFGFDEFTHLRTVVSKDTFFSAGPPIPHPPHGDALYDLAVKARITGFLSSDHKRYIKYGLAGLATIGGAGLLRARL